MPAAFFFLIGIAGLWWGTEMVLRRVPRVARSFRISPLTVTVLFLAIMTSLPELCVSMLAALDGRSSAALGNIVGSNLVTMTFVTAVSALWKPFKVGSTIRERESCWMIMGSSLLLLLALDGLISRTDGLVLICGYIPYLVETLKEAKEHRSKSIPNNTRINIADLLLFPLGIMMVLVGAKLVVEEGTTLARSLGMSDLMIGITFFAFGTSLPELAIAFGAAVKGKGDVTLGETYASNIFTGLMVTGLVALAHPLDVEQLILTLDLPLLIFSGSILQIFITSGEKYVRSEAAIMMAVYVLFLTAHFFNFNLALP